jgi:hypothetical protein
MTTTPGAMYAKKRSDATVAMNGLVVRKPKKNSCDAVHPRAGNEGDYRRN